MTKKQKLELTWIGKENRPRLEPRILLEDPAKSYHAKARSSRRRAKQGRLRIFAPSREDEIGDLFDDRLIFGDYLLALKALESRTSALRQNIHTRRKLA